MLILAGFCLPRRSNRRKLRGSDFSQQPPGLASAHLTEAFLQGLRDLGYVEGQNIAIEYRWADGNFERLPELAAELVRLKVDLIVATVTQASLAAKNATATIPIVMVAVGSPVEAGLIASLARPGANITGTSTMADEVVGKQLGLLKETLPKISRWPRFGILTIPSFRRRRCDRRTARRRRCP